MNFGISKEDMKITGRIETKGKEGKGWQLKGAQPQF